MTPRQHISYNAPCFHASETMSERYYWWLLRGSRIIGINLTCNIGLE